MRLTYEWFELLLTVLEKTLVAEGAVLALLVIVADLRPVILSIESRRDRLLGRELATATCRGTIGSS